MPSDEREGADSFRVADYPTRVFSSSASHVSRECETLHRSALTADARRQMAARQLRAHLTAVVALRRVDADLAEISIARLAFLEFVGERAMVRLHKGINVRRGLSSSGLTNRALT